MKNIIVTGGAGFIGSNFVRYMLNKYPEYQIINVDMLTYAGNLKNLEDIANSHNYHFIKMDIRDKAKVNEVFNNYNIDMVVNFAAESHVDRSIDEPEIFLSTNTIGTQVLLDIAKKHWKTNPTDKYCKDFKRGVKFLQVSTDEVYGTLRATGMFVETMPLLPNSPYSASKASADLMVRAYHETYGMPVVITRCSNNYGPYQFPEKLIPLMINNCLNDNDLPVYGDGLQVRDWLHVYDHCSAIDVVLHKGINGEIYNVGGNNEKANIEIIRLIIKTLGKSESLIRFVKDRPGHDRRYAIDNAKITTQLGWKPVYTFEQGIKDTIEWYLKNPEWTEDIVSGDYVNYYNKMYGQLTKEMNDTTTIERAVNEKSAQNTAKLMDMEKYIDAIAADGKMSEPETHEEAFVLDNAKFGKINVSVLGRTRYNLLKTPKMDTDSDSDGVANDWSGTKSANCAGTFSIDDNAQKVDITFTASANINMMEVNQWVMGLSAGDAFSFSVQCRKVGDVILSAQVQFYTAENEYLGGKEILEQTYESYAELKIENCVAPVNTVKAFIRMYTGVEVPYNTGTSWWRNALFEKAEKAGRCILQPESVQGLKIGIKRPRPRVIIMFDDEVSRVHSIVYPYYRDRRIPLTISVVSSFVGSDPFYMDLAQLTEMYNGGCDLINHTATHVNLKTLPAAQIAAEIQTCRDWLIVHGFTRAANFLTYPQNDYNSEIQEIARSLGVKAARTGPEGLITYPLPDLWALPVMLPLECVTTLQDCKDAIDLAINTGGTVIIFGHDVKDIATDPYTVSTAVAKGLADYIAETDIEAVTISQWYNDLFSYDGDMSSDVVLRSMPNGICDVFKNRLIIRYVGIKTGVASGTLINYPDMSNEGQFVAWNAAGGLQTGIKGDSLNIDNADLHYQLSIPVTVPAIPVYNGNLYALGANTAVIPMGIDGAMPALTEAHTI